MFGRRHNASIQVLAASRSSPSKCYAEALYLASPGVPDGLLPILIMIAIVIVYTIAKIVAYVRKSEQQWQQADKSKLREWDDEDD